MIVRQSDLKSWARCPLQWRFEHIDGVPREQGGASVFGTVMHLAVLKLETSGDLEATTQWFKQAWTYPADPVTGVGPDQGRIDYWERGQSHKKGFADGERILRDWWSIIQWETDLVLAREHSFEVDIGDGHRLRGTADKICIRYNAKLDRLVLLISDYKTSAKRPTYDYLEDDLQFSAYGYASLKKEFWTGIQNGERLWRDYLLYPRWGEWVHLKGPMRLDAGERRDVHYNRLVMAVDAFALSVDLRVFVPQISGETCKWCPHRKHCGLPPVINP